MDKKETLKRLRSLYNTEEVELSGYGIYVVTQDYWNNDSRNNPLFVDSKGEEIEFMKDYDSIRMAACSVLVVCKSNQEVLKGKPLLTRQCGLIDLNGSILIPCSYDSINVHLDGFIQLSKNGLKKSTNISIVKSGEFIWDEALV